VAARVGGPATIEDADSRLLAFSTPQDPVDERRRRTILGRATPDEYQRGMRHAGVFLRLHESAEPMLLPADPGEGLRARLAIAIKTGEEVLGYLWVVEGERPLDGDAAKALRELAPVVALHLLRVIAAGSAERNRRRDLVLAALDGTWSADHSAELPLRRGERVIVACLAPDSDDGTDFYRSEQACQIVELHLATYRARGMVARRGGRVFCLFPAGGVEASSYQQEAVGELLEKLTVSLGVAFRAGIGEPVVPHALRGSRADAEWALRTGQELGLPARTTHIADVRDQALLVMLRDVAELRPLLERGSVARIREHDAARDTAYEESLRAYLDCQCNIPAAANALHVHPNTLRHRLTRIADGFALHLDDPHERLALGLELWLLPVHVKQRNPDDHQ
jgi:DNA-binding PucR family transcriptional regulator